MFMQTNVPHELHFLTLLRLALLIISFFSFLFANPIISQAIQIREIRVFQLQYEQGDFWELNAYTGEKVMLFSFEPQLGQILDFEVNPELNVVYILEGAGCCGGITAGQSRISKMDLDTGKVEIVFAERNLFEIDSVPDPNYLLVSFYDPDLESVSVAARDGLVEHCMLDLQTRMCTDEFGVSNYNLIDWISQDQFIGSVRNESFQGTSYLVGAASSGRVELPVYSPYWTSIPSTDEILSTTGMGAGSFTRISLDTLDIDSYDIEGIYDSSAQFYPVSFSPNGEHLLFLYEHTYMVAEFPSGEIVAVLSNAFDPHWIDAENLIYSQFAELGTYPGEIRRYNLASGQDIDLIEFEERTQIAVVRPP